MEEDKNSIPLKTSAENLKHASKTSRHGTFHFSRQRMRQPLLLFLSSFVVSLTCIGRESSLWVPYNYIHVSMCMSIMLTVVRGPRSSIKAIAKPPTRADLCC